MHPVCETFLRLEAAPGGIKTISFFYPLRESRRRVCPLSCRSVFGQQAGGWEGLSEATTAPDSCSAAWTLTCTRSKSVQVPLINTASKSTSPCAHADAAPASCGGSCGRSYGTLAEKHEPSNSPWWSRPGPRPGTRVSGHRWSCWAWPEPCRCTCGPCLQTAPPPGPDTACRAQQRSTL